MSDDLNALLERLIESREREVARLETMLFAAELDLKGLIEQRETDAITQAAAQRRDPRAAVRDLLRDRRSLTASQTSRALGITPQTAHKHLKALAHNDPPIAAQRPGHPVRYVYLQPIPDAGPVSRPRYADDLNVEEVTRGAPVAGTARVAIRDKELRRVVEWAVRHGCQYVPAAGGGHGRLLDRNGKTITMIVSTPQNSDDAADAVKRALTKAGVFAA